MSYCTVANPLESINLIPWFQNTLILEGYLEQYKQRDSCLTFCAYMCILYIHYTTIGWICKTNRYRDSCFPYNEFFGDFGDHLTFMYVLLIAGQISTCSATVYLSSNGSTLSWWWLHAAQSTAKRITPMTENVHHSLISWPKFYNVELSLTSWVCTEDKLSCFITTWPFLCRYPQANFVFW